MIMVRGCNDGIPKNWVSDAPQAVRLVRAQHHRLSVAAGSGPVAPQRVLVLAVDQSPDAVGAGVAIALA